MAKANLEYMKDPETGLWIEIGVRRAGGGGGGTGADGGFYTPAVTQPEPGKMTVSYTPSAAGMPPVPNVTINLPEGESGFSPTVKVEPIVGGNKVTITDENGPKSFDVLDASGVIDDRKTGEDTTYSSRKIKEEYSVYFIRASNITSDQFDTYETPQQISLIRSSGNIVFLTDDFFGERGSAKILGVLTYCNPGVAVFVGIEVTGTDEAPTGFTVKHYYVKQYEKGKIFSRTI